MLFHVKLFDLDIFYVDSYILHMFHFNGPQFQTI